MESIQPPGQIVTIGEAAHGLLASQTRGKILAVVSQAAYLLNENGEVFWLASENVPLHRRGIQISVPFPRLTVEAPFTLDASHLILDPGTSLDYSQVPIWSPPPFHPKGLLPVDDLRRQFSAFPSVLEGLPAPNGFGVLIPDILLTVSDQVARGPDPIQTPIMARAGPVVMEIARACLVHDFLKITQSAFSLAGLGEGLTPSGDDFIGGLLFCRKILQDSYPELQDLEFPDLPGFVEKIKGSTNIISYTFLKDHAGGFSLDTFHRFAAAFLRGQPLSRLYPIVSELIQIGHSTGWDLLAGFLTGMLLVNFINH